MTKTILEGTRLAGRYDVVSEIGRGGMGIVYMCRDLVTGDRVALKLLNTADGTPMPGYAAWFWAEARALASLDHPCIVRGRDFGVIATKAPYLVMDFAPGVSLTSLVMEQNLEWPAIWLIADQVLAALAHAHARGVIHGDLKHTNIMVDVHPGALHVRLLDFGLAWLLRDRFDHRLDGTAPEGPMVRPHAGTVGWMAPEQIRGAIPHVGPATDLYALGCILFQLLTGHEPYEASDLTEVQKMHRNDPVPLVPVPEDFPDGVALFVQRLLAKRPWQRYDFAADARAVLAQLRPEGDPSAWSLPRRPTASVSVVESAPPAGLLKPKFEIPAADPAFAGMVGFGPPRFVGRKRHRLLLRSYLDDIVTAPAGTQQLVVLTGQPGVGKSRLAEWLCEEAHESGLAVPLRARHHKISAPLDGFVGAVLAHFGLENADRSMTERVLINLWDVGKYDEERLRWVAAVAEWLRPSAPERRTTVGPSGQRVVVNTDEIRWAVMLYVLERIGKARPVLLWLDDIHLASLPETEWLLPLRQEGIGSRVLIVATMTTEVTETELKWPAHAQELVELFGGRAVDVEPFDEQETRDLLLSSLSLDPDAVETAYKRSKGVPLFALQLVHAWVNGGSLEFKDGTYHVKRSALGAIPATTASLWDERLGSLPEQVRLVAMAAAALGGDIRVDVLVRLLTSLDLIPSVTLPRLELAQILVKPDPARYRWVHMLLQEHLFRMLQARPDAANVFRAAASTLASYHPGAGTRRIVRHRVLNLTLAGDVDEAVQVMLDFVERAWERTRDVSATLEDLAMIERHVQGRAAALHARWKAEALQQKGRFEEAMTLAFSARRSFAALEDVYNEAQCLRLLGHLASEKGSPRDGRKMAAEACAMMESIQNEHGRAQCEVVMGELDHFLGKWDQAQQELEHALGPFENAHNSLGRGQCLVLLSWIAMVQGNVNRARDYLVAARQDFDRIGYRLGVAQCDLSLARADHRVGEIEAARARAQNALSAFKLQGTPRGQARALRLLAMAAIDAGDLTEAEERAFDALHIYDRLGDPSGIVEAKLLLAQVSLAHGLPDARERVARCDISGLQEPEALQHWHLTRSWLAHREGRHDEALQQLLAARDAMAVGLGDHATQLFARLASMFWPDELQEQVAEACSLTDRIGEKSSRSPPANPS